MKAGQTYMVAKQFIDAAVAEGATVYEQRGFYKVGKSPTAGACLILQNKDEPTWTGEQFMYVSRPSKALEGNVARVDLSGFTVADLEQVVNLGGESFGRVHQQLRFDKPAADILVAFRALVTGLGTHVALPKKERVRPVALKGTKLNAPTADVTVVAASTPADEINKLVAKRKMLIEMGEKTGKPVSPKTLTLIGEKLTSLGYVEQVA